MYCAMRPFHRVRLLNLSAASAIGAVFACWAAISGLGFWTKITCCAAFALILPVICCGFSGIKAASALIVMGAAAAAILPLLSAALPLFLAFPASGIASYILFSAKRRCLDSWEGRAEIYFSRKRAAVDGLIDTGNRLTEPISGLPVMIVCAEKIEKLLPDGFDPHAPYSTLPDGFRLVGYGGVGGAGEMGCFMPDEIRIFACGRLFRRKDALWVAVYPGKLPGGTAVLIPYSAIQ